MKCNDVWEFGECHNTIMSAVNYMHWQNDKATSTHITILISLVFKSCIHLTTWRWYYTYTLTDVLYFHGDVAAWRVHPVWRGGHQGVTRGSCTVLVVAAGPQVAGLGRGGAQALQWGHHAMTVGIQGQWGRGRTMSARTDRQANHSVIHSM